ncbi:hypothetical protein [Allorhizocola rhizosphaerae]|uniref:hypothetical protein n=1 Tax=Allorhizocola rhizosphaerae TaxID=1872709 RepID=UPI001FE3CDC7|nr:hypothetical protein [Allorhizocola rhizosphaerae]
MSTTERPDLADSPGVRSSAPGALLRRLRGVPARRLRDPIIGLGFLLLALWLTLGLWSDPDTRTLALNPADQVLVEWFLSYGGRFWVGDFSLLSDRLNAPDGINMLTNAATVGLGVIFAPVTWLFGAATTFAVIMVVNLAGTAMGWYLLFSRTLGATPLAAIVGGFFCGFAPGMVSQANSHLHMTAQWLVPAMIWCVIALWRAAGESQLRAKRVIIVSVGFGLLVTVQVFIGEETLYLTAFTLVLVSLFFLAIQRPPARRIGRFALGLAIAVGVAVPLLAYPLWMQFRGPQSVPNGVFSPDYFVADLASFVAYSPLSLFGSAETARLSTGPAEYNTFLGWPLLILIMVLVVWLYQRPIVIPMFLTGLIMCWLSLGPMIVMDRRPTGLAGPYQLLKGIPVIDGALPLRFALVAIPLIAILLVFAIDEAWRSGNPWVRWSVPASIGLALLPILPVPLPTADRAPVPRFYAEGHWRQCADEGDVIVPVPLPTPPEPQPMRFAADQNAAFGMPEGFFIGPYGRGGRATIGTWKRPTSALLAEVAKTGELAEVTDQNRAQARLDLAKWGATCVVLTEHKHRAALQTTVEQLLGPGRVVSDAVIWPLR